MNPGAVAELLKSWAVEEGFDRAGAARLGPSDFEDALRAWLGRGEHAEMGYLERRVEERLDPRRLFDGAKSVLCVAQQYFPLSEQAEEPPDRSIMGRVARYARGTDYHDTMKKRLDRLAERVRERFPEALTRTYVDTGPVLERELAARAGIGSFGKNTNLLHPEAGSWFFLGELFLSLDLAPDTPIAELCGTCSRCLEACPTGALPQPFHLDATRCISYWTIEHRGSLPESAREMVGDWLFGCDICQEVCPLNDDPRPVASEEFEAPVARSELEFSDLLTLTREEYVERFRRSPMKRAKLEGLQRNAAVVLGNSGNQDAVPTLIEALGHPDPVVRGHAAWSLGRLGGTSAEQALVQALAREAESAVKVEIEAAISRFETA